MLYVDIPTSEDIAALACHRGDACVSIYLPTTPRPVAQRHPGSTAMPAVITGQHVKID